MELPVVPDLPLRTRRLVLRPFGRDDLEPLLVFHSDPDAVRYVPYPAAEPRRRGDGARTQDRQHRAATGG